MKKIIPLLIILFVFLGCSPSIKTITKYTKKDGVFVKTSIAEFDKNGNKILVRGLGNSRSNRITKATFKENYKIFETSCDYFEKQDTCVIRSFSKLEFDIAKGIDKLTLFEADSSIRHIKETKRIGDMAIEKIYSWEMFPTKKPNLEKAIQLTDTIYFDNKGREIKRLNYNAKIKEPFIEIYRYYKNGYTYEITGTRDDKNVYFKLNKLQKRAIKKGIDYRFYNSNTNKYEFEYY